MKKDWGILQAGLARIKRLYAISGSYWCGPFDPVGKSQDMNPGLTKKWNMVDRNILK